LPSTHQTTTTTSSSIATSKEEAIKSVGISFVDTANMEIDADLVVKILSTTTESTLMRERFASPRCHKEYLNNGSSSSPEYSDDDSGSYPDHGSGHILV
jgi:hypothetical protein